MKKLPVILSLALLHCGQGLLEVSGPPALQSVSRATGSVIAENTTITLGYNQNLGSVSLGGTLASEAKTSISGSSVSISATSSFTAGLGRQLTVTPVSVAGIEGETTTLSYDVYVFSNAVYVSHDFGNDNNVGTLPLPKQTITAAITTASQVLGTGTVRIASKTGSYDLGNATLNLVNGVSLEGGYLYNGTTWSGPDATTNETIIARSAGSGGGIDDPVAALTCGSGITSNTSVSKLTIQGAALQYTTAARADSGCQALFFENKITAGLTDTTAGRSYGFYIGTGASPTIRFNTINPGNHTSAPTLSSISAIRLVGGSPLIERNLLARGINNAGTSTSSFTLFVKDVTGNPQIRNNLVYGGQSAAISTAMLFDNANGRIYNNTIIGGQIDIANPVEGIVMRNGSSPSIRNNIITKQAAPATTLTCIKEESSGTNNPADVQNNGLYSCDTLYIDENPTQNFTELCSGNFGRSSCANTLNSPAATGNISGNPVFTDLAGGNLNIGAAAYQSGGLDLSSFFANDITDTTRTSWSIGAYE